MPHSSRKDNEGSQSVALINVIMDVGCWGKEAIFGKPGNDSVTLEKTLNLEPIQNQHTMRIIFIFLALFTIFSCTNTKDQEERIVIQNYYWAKEGKIEEVYQHRLYASEVRKKLGLEVGRVLKRTTTDGELPHVIWECEYESEEARQEDVRKLSESGAFDTVQEKMSTLIEKFDRGMYRID